MKGVKKVSWSTNQTDHSRKIEARILDKYANRISSLTQTSNDIGQGYFVFDASSNVSGCYLTMYFPSIVDATFNINWLEIVYDAEACQAANEANGEQNNES